MQCAHLILSGQMLHPGVGVLHQALDLSGLTFRRRDARAACILRSANRKYADGWPTQLQVRPTRCLADSASLSEDLP